MTEHAYLFQAKGIQRYILEGGKLKDMVGASELISSLCRSDRRDLLEKVLNAASFPEPRRLSRRAGGAFMLHYDERQAVAFERFRTLWRLTVAMTAPGVEFNEAFGQGAGFLDARKSVRENQSGLRENSLASLLPVAGPLVLRAQRTGLAAVTVEHRGQEEREELDAVTVAKRKLETGSGVIERFKPGKNDLAESVGTPDGDWRWPRNMEEDFPFKGRKQWVGIVHADISGLGQMWRKFEETLKDKAEKGETKNDLAGDCLAHSQKIEDAVNAAAKYATGQILAPATRSGDRMMPARPIILSLYVGNWPFLSPACFSKHSKRMT
jgi:hypothetical protein